MEVREPRPDENARLYIPLLVVHETPSETKRGGHARDRIGKKGWTKGISEAASNGWGKEV